MTSRIGWSASENRASMISRSAASISPDDSLSAARARMSSSVTGASAPSSLTRNRRKMPRVMNVKLVLMGCRMRDNDEIGPATKSENPSG